MSSPKHSKEQILTDEHFLLGSESEGHLQSVLETNDDDFVGDQNDYDEMSSDAPLLSEWKTVDTDIKLTCNECKNNTLSHLVSEMEFIEHKLKKSAWKTYLNLTPRLDNVYS